jgi:hypothetical protein
MWSGGKLDGKFELAGGKDPGRRIDTGRESSGGRSSVGGRAEREATGLSFVAVSLFRGGTTRIATPFS